MVWREVKVRAWGTGGQSPVRLCGRWLKSRSTDRSPRHALPDTSVCLCSLPCDALRVPLPPEMQPGQCVHVRCCAVRLAVRRPTALGAQAALRPRRNSPQRNAASRATTRQLIRPLLLLLLLRVPAGAAAAHHASRPAPPPVAAASVVHLPPGRGARGHRGGHGRAAPAARRDSGDRVLELRAQLHVSDTLHARAARGAQGQGRCAIARPRTRSTQWGSAGSTRAQKKLAPPTTHPASDAALPTYSDHPAHQRVVKASVRGAPHRMRAPRLRCPGTGASHADASPTPPPPSPPPRVRPQEFILPIKADIAALDYIV